MIGQVCGDHQAALHRSQLEISRQMEKSWSRSLHADTETLCLVVPGRIFSRVLYGLSHVFLDCSINDLKAGEKINK